VSHGLDLEEVDDLLDELALADLLLPAGAEVEEGLPHRVAHVNVPAQHQVVQHAHVLEQLDVLEGSCHPPAGDAARPRAGELVPRLRVLVEDDVPLLRAVQAADAVQQAGLAGTVGTDHGMDRALPDRHPDTRQRPDAAEAQVHRLGLELDLARGTPAAVERVPVVAVDHGHLSLNPGQIDDSRFPLFGSQCLLSGGALASTAGRSRA
jgi:hypothetical protein